MSKTVRWLIVLFVLVTSVTCQLVETPQQVQISQPTQPSQKPVPTEAPQPPAEVALPPAAEVNPPQLAEPVPTEIVVNSELKTELEDLRSELNDLGNFSGFDENALPELIYFFNADHLDDRLIAMPSLHYLKKDGNKYQTAYQLSFLNMGASQKSFQYTFEVPENFAAQVDQLVFTPEPTRILKRSPVVVQYDVILAGRSSSAVVPAALRWDIPNRKSVRIQKLMEETILDPKKALLEMAYPAARNRCDQLVGDEADKCYLNLEEKFRGTIEKNQQMELCKFIGDSVFRALCKVLVNDDPSECDYLVTGDVCRGYLTVNQCAGLEGKAYEDCLIEKSVKNRAYVACLATIEDEDFQNECLARVTRKEQYCKDIQNTARKTKCLALFKKPEQAAQPAQPAQPAKPAAPPGPVNTNVNGYKLWAEFATKVAEEYNSCNARMCQPKGYLNCATHCRGVGGYFDRALYSDYFLHIHSAYLPLANTVAEYLIDSLKKCDDAMIFADPKDQERIARYETCIKDFNTTGVQMLEEAFDTTCAAWCADQGKSGGADGVPRTCVCN